MGQKYALLVGSSGYSDSSLPPLPKAAHDARAVARVLQDPAIGGFAAADVLVDQDCALVQARIAEFFNNRLPEDTLLLFFSGHGLLDDFDEPYLAVRDTKKSNPLGTAISRDFVTKAMDRSRSKRQVLILDCCASGKFGLLRKGAWPGAAVFKGNGDGRVVMTASAGDSSAFEADDAIGPSANSVFTHLILTGIESGLADTDGDGVITAGELYLYVRDEAIRRKLKQGPPKQYGDSAVERSVEVARNRAPSVLPDPLQEKLRRGTVGDLLASIPELEAVARGENPRLQRVALRELEKLRTHDSSLVSAAAAGSLRRLHGSRITRLWNSNKAKLPGLSAAALMVGVLAGAGWLLYAYNTQGIYALEDIPLQTALEPKIVRSYATWIRPRSRPVDPRQIQDRCAGRTISRDERLAFSDLAPCKGLILRVRVPKQAMFQEAWFQPPPPLNSDIGRPTSFQDVAGQCAAVDLKPGQLITESVVAPCRGFRFTHNVKWQTQFLLDRSVQADQPELAAGQRPSNFARDLENQCVARETKAGDVVTADLVTHCFGLRFRRPVPPDTEFTPNMFTSDHAEQLDDQRVHRIVDVTPFCNAIPAKEHDLLTDEHLASCPDRPKI